MSIIKYDNKIQIRRCRSCTHATQLKDNDSFSCEKKERSAARSWSVLDSQIKSKALREECKFYDKI